LELSRRESRLFPATRASYSVDHVISARGVLREEDRAQSLDNLTIYETYAPRSSRRPVAHVTWFFGTHSLRRLRRTRRVRAHAACTSVHEDWRMRDNNTHTHIRTPSCWFHWFRGRRRSVSPSCRVVSLVSEGFSVAFPSWEPTHVRARAHVLRVNYVCEGVCRSVVCQRVWLATTSAGWVKPSRTRPKMENTTCPTNVLESASVPGLMMLLATLIAGGIVLVICYAVSRRSRSRQDSKKSKHSFSKSILSRRLRLIRVPHTHTHTHTCARAHARMCVRDTSRRRPGRAKIGLLLNALHTGGARHAHGLIWFVGHVSSFCTSEHSEPSDFSRQFRRVLTPHVFKSSSFRSKFPNLNFLSLASLALS